MIQQAYDSLRWNDGMGDDDLTVTWQVCATVIQLHIYLYKNPKLNIKLHIKMIRDFYAPHIHLLDTAKYFDHFENFDTHDVENFDTKDDQREDIRKQRERRWYK